MGVEHRRRRGVEPSAQLVRDWSGELAAASDYGACCGSRGLPCAPPMRNLKGRAVAGPLANRVCLRPASYLALCQPIGWVWSSVLLGVSLVRSFCFVVLPAMCARPCEFGSNPMRIQGRNFGRAQPRIYFVSLGSGMDGAHSDGAYAPSLGWKMFMGAPRSFTGHSQAQRRHMSTLQFGTTYALFPEYLVIERLRLPIASALTIHCVGSGSR